MREETAVKPTPQPFAPAATGLLQRKCACGKHTTDQHGQCTECKKKGQLLQRRAVNQNGPAVAPPIVHEVLRSPGRPLDPATRAYMEPRFGRDFSRVRVHTGAKAGQSARAVNAQAYTVGANIVFAAGQYTPATNHGRSLLAHELTHTVQQGQSASIKPNLTIASTNGRLENAAEQTASKIQQGQAFPIEAVANDGQLHRRIGDGHDLSATRFAGNVVLEAVYDNERLLKRGHKGTAVRLVQESLLAQGYALPAHGADADFGSETEAAVRAFQIDAGAEKLDGIIGPETMRLLDMRDPGGTTATGPLATPPPAGVPAAPAATGAVFSEDPRETFAGYDNSAAPNWLVVPENERRRARAVITPAGARPAFVSNDPATATVEVAPDGVVVTGLAHGATEIRAQEGGVTLARLRVAVKRQLRRSVAFHFVRDSAVPPHRARPTPSANEMRSLLNRVWELQANVLFTGGTAHNVVAPGDLGLSVDWTSPGGGEWNTVTALGTGADYNVFRVWRYMQDGTWPNDAANLGPNTLIGDNPCADGLGLAHECGHFLGLDHPDGFIMQPCGTRTDRRVSKAMADRVNP